MARLTKRQAETIRNAIEHARMTRANFAESGRGGAAFVTEREVTGFIIGRTRIYRESWIIEPLEQLLRDAGEEV